MEKIKRNGKSVVSLSVEDIKKVVSSYHSARGFFVPTTEIEISVTISTDQLMGMLLRRLFKWMTIPLLLVQSIKEVLHEERAKKLKGDWRSSAREHGYYERR